MKLRLKFVFAILLISFVNNVLADDGKENQSLFNLSETPFINIGKYSVFLSYCFNQGPPSLIIEQWQLPDDSKNILFKEYKAGFSIGERFSFVYKKITGNKLEFNESHIGKHTIPNLNYFSLKYKIYKSENYFPDYTIGINTQKNQELISIDFMIGSMRENLKYYAYSAIGLFYFIPIPYNLAAGISYEILNNFNLLAEIQPIGDYDDNYRALLFGVNYTIFQFASFHLSLYYFDFKFKNSIPFRDGLTWQDPLNIITVPEKDKYYLLSFRVSFALNEKIFQK